ncbi:MAG TPA: uroporphyrinogen-III synthase [Candidatus Kapabacteria bacterium]|nr:uroporphyrinogen-III synthase [Candidatus Kapabacteria bacterium]
MRPGNRIASVLLTRSAGENARTAPFFEARGFTVYSVPMVELRPIPKDACGVRQVRRLAGGEPVLLTSAFAADQWLDLRETDFHEHAPAAYYVVGERSAALLREGDPDVPIAACEGSAEELATDAFAGVHRLLYPCSTEHRDELPARLRAAGVEVIEMPIYSPVLPTAAGSLLPRTIAAMDAPFAVAFFSPSAVRNFFALAPDVPPSTIFCAIGTTTAEALRHQGAAPAVIAAHPSAQALAEALAAQSS